MQTNHSGRITLISVVLLAALWAIFPSPGALFDSSIPLSQKLNLKPGIDMVGGTSLLYEIKPPGEGHISGNLAEQVMESLKKRVDPDGVRNLIWRPQGDRRLEIQMPTSAGSEKSGETRLAYSKARADLDATNVKLAQVLSVVEQPATDARRDKLNKLSMGSDSRGKLLGAMASVWDQIQQARKDQKADVEAAKSDEYDALKDQVEASNLSLAELEAVLTQPDPKVRDAKLAEIKKKNESFKQRLDAIDKFAAIYSQYNSIKGSIDDSGDLKRLLKGSGVLEFHILVTDLQSTEAQAMRERLRKSGPGVQAQDQMRWYAVARPEEFHSPTTQYGDKFYALAWTISEKSMTNRPGQNPWHLESAYPTQSDIGGRVVGFSFDAQGAKYFSDLTGANINRPLAIMLDDKIISAPNIKSQIGRHGTIDGGEKGYTDSELGYLISTLNAGSLPAQLAEEPISERTVGPQLGEDNLKSGLLGCVLGLVVVAIFMISYYYLSGIVATIAVLMNIVLILGALASLNATFTLPGIAGIVLTIGAAVDANVLIFERLREEQHRGLSIRMALRNAYDRAFSAILDSNATTMITSLILYWLGSEEVKGFGLTLLIGLVSSLFTSLFVTRTIFNILIERFGVQNLGSLPLSFPKWDKMLAPKVDWMKLSPYFYVISALILGFGCWSFVSKFRSGEMLDIEFASGTQVQFELRQPTKIEDVRKLIDDYRQKKQAGAGTGAAGAKAADPLPSPSVVSVGNDDKVYEIVTPNADAVVVRDAVLGALGDRLKVDLPSKFAQVGEPVEKAMKQAILPVDKDPFAVDGVVAHDAAAHVQGAAIVLRDLNPPMRPSEIKERIERQRLQVQPGESTPEYRDYVINSRDTSDNPTDFAIVLVSDPALPYDKDETKWRDELVAPMWKLLNEGINRPAQLQGVKNFDASIAGDTQRDALMALALSVVVIMAYIWLRFGNLRYGTATVVAMIHDTMLVIGAVGIAHLIEPNSGLAKTLMIEPFRVNLTLVAAILTVMSYSMIDTIVVFDRVRENRGRDGHLSRQILNDSINQTLSRTMLTAGTNVVTVLSMYIFGGPGIHGFTFVLLIGIICGTYSSFAIAAPILLFGSDKKAPVTGKKAAGGQLQRATG